MTDEQYMGIAVEEAWKGCGHVNPNPMVGCVIVKNGAIIGKGFHGTYGGLHAERNALASCATSPEGATVYVTLEPCCHWGKTPPCTDALIAAKVARVVSGSADPNPLVSGKSAATLMEAGIETESGVLKEKCDALNEAFFHYIRAKTPFVILKYAMTADGKIATITGKSKWITGEAARRRVHFDRHRYAAVLVGVGTVLADDPMLSCRFENTGDDVYPSVGEPSHPLRIICDSSLRTPPSSRLVKTARDFPTLIATAVSDREKYKPYLDSGCRVLNAADTGNGGAGGGGNRVDLPLLMKKLGGMGVDSVIIEGGAEIAWSALKSRVVCKTNIYIAPKIFGGAAGKTAVGGSGALLPEEAFALSAPEITVLGGDILLESRTLYRD